mmetsp:Transcript_6817/g.18027  ORF Transcript_6817/g.18027 Transcript_6817/m.18027 type:complete len:205 (-) Transcript_6817:868-1482(-)
MCQWVVKSVCRTECSCCHGLLGTSGGGENFWFCGMRPAKSGCSQRRRNDSLQIRVASRPSRTRSIGLDIGAPQTSTPPPYAATPCVGRERTCGASWRAEAGMRRAARLWIPRIHLARSRAPELLGTSPRYRRRGGSRRSPTPRAHRTTSRSPGSWRDGGASTSSSGTASRRSARTCPWASSASWRSSGATGYECTRPRSRMHSA